jgi:hypothetical protein
MTLIRQHHVCVILVIAARVIRSDNDDAYASI